ncbi:uncharacterized protein LOC133321085 [Musca vetustissima]|uniref:uncharacterized protein LOC133321085 n=1 Tax=Musca vetustissima TaxID=27455 RepID=UPI002AB6DBC3|nr:uncharacterized protein LOC133321085 [Musca vetustissima]
MKFLQSAVFVLLFTICYLDLCSTLFFKPWIKSLRKSVGYGNTGRYYGYQNPYYGYNSNYYNYGYFGSGGGGGYNRPGRRPGGKRTGRTYSDIARVVNPNPYAFVGQRPYPAQPFYPIG